MFDNLKLYTLEEASAMRSKIDGSVVVTNGCFDWLHAGHLSYLRAAASLGDAMFVLINSDASVRALKGETRPIFSETERAYALGALECVSGVVIFDTERANRELKALSPDIYVKAGDYTEESLDRTEYAALREVGARIEFMPFVEGYSTTSLIQRVGEVAQRERVEG